MTDRDSVIKGLELLAHWPDGLIFTDKEKWIKPCCETAVALLKEQEAEARLLTAEEVQNMEAGTAFGIETYYDHDGERVPGCAWALRTERLILSFFGTMFPDTVTKIPYNTLEMNQNTGKHEKHQYRFWSKKPTFEQCKAVKWE